jgi:tetratricopeptide (TPR) repeat protein
MPRPADYLHVERKESPGPCSAPLTGTIVARIKILMATVEKFIARFARLVPFLAAALFLLAAGQARAGDKADGWTQVRSPHFIVATDSGAKQGRRVADQFEQVRAVFQKLLPRLRTDAAQPIIILAVKDQKSLRALIPEYWERKGQAHPGGVFVSGNEKNYVALRLDAESDSAYSLVYHEYVHSLMRLNFESVPTWLNEGLAEFYAHMTIGEKQVLVGEASRSHVLLLRESKLLPLEALFAADSHSPLYNEENTVSIFYAQSWALTHYLMLGDHGAHTALLSQYLRLVVDEHVDQVEAAHRAFGDFAALARAIDGYTGRQSFSAMMMKLPAQLGEKDFPSRRLSPAESLALRGDFHVYEGRPQDARPLLEQAVQLDPKLAAPRESLGVLALEAGDLEKAVEEFTAAVQLDSQSYLAYYYSALTVLRGAASPSDLERAKSTLQRSIDLNPQFAPAHSALASLYSRRRDQLPEALSAAQKAHDLEPGVQAHLVNLGFILLGMGRTHEAQQIAHRAAAEARNPRELADASALEHVVNQSVEFAQRQEMALRISDSAAGRRLEIPDPPAGATQAEGIAGIAPKPGPAPELTGELKSFAGNVAEAECEGYLLHLKISDGSHTQELRATDYTRIEYLAYAWEPPANFSPCKDLKGLHVQAFFRWIADAAYEGEVSKIEVNR